MLLNYTKIVNQIDGKKTAKVQFFGMVGTDTNGHYVAKDLYNLAEMPNIDSVEIHINSAGGGVVEGYSIIQALKELEKTKSVTVVNIGVAYSIAGIIFASAQNRIILDYATVMIHDPYLSNVETMDEKQKDVVTKIKSSLETILSNSTGQTVDFISEKMTKQTVLNAKECLKLGFTDEIKKTTKKPKITNNIKETVLNCQNLFLENENENKQKKDNMLLNELLGLKPEASETSQVDAVKNLIEIKKEAQKTKDELTRAKAENDVLKAENSAIKEQIMTEKAEILVNKAIETGKILKTSKEIWIKNAVSNFEQTEILINSLNAVPVLNNEKTPTAKGTEDAQVDYRKIVNEFSKLKPQEIEKLPKEKIQLYEKALENI